MKKEDVFKLKDLIWSCRQYLDINGFYAQGTGDNDDLRLEITWAGPSYALKPTVQLVQLVTFRDGSRYSHVLDSSLIDKLDIDWVVPKIFDILDELAQAIIYNKKEIADVDARYHKIKVMAE